MQISRETGGHVMKGKDICWRPPLLLLMLLTVLACAETAQGVEDTVLVKGYVYDADHDPLDEVTVKFYQLEEGREYETDTGVNTGGYYQIEVIEGHYTIAYTKDGYLANYRSDVEIFPEPSDTLRLDDTVLETPPSPDYVFNGTVLYNGTGLENVRVHLYDRDRDYWTKTVLTDAHGNFSIETYAGTFILYWDEDGKLINSTEVTVPSPDLILRIDDLPERYRVDGLVCDEEGEGIGGARITLYPMNSTHMLDDDISITQTTTAISGYASLEVYAGDYTVIIDADGYEAYIDTITVSSDRRFSDQYEIHLRRTPTGKAKVEMAFDASWNATVTVVDAIFEDAGIWNFTWDRELKDLYDAYGYGREILSADDLGDGMLSADEIALLEELLTYRGMPEEFEGLLKMDNGSLIVPDPLNLSTDVDLVAMEIVWTLDLHSGINTSTFLTLTLRVNYDSDRNYTYIYRIPHGWFVVNSSSAENINATVDDGTILVDPSEGVGAVDLNFQVSNDDMPPVADFVAEDLQDGRINESMECIFNASASIDQGNNQTGIVLYMWDFGDNTTLNRTSPIASHSYNVPGGYIVMLRVMDRAGRMSEPVELMLTVMDVTPPSISVSGPSTVNLTLNGTLRNLTSVRFNVTITDPDGVDKDYVIVWDFGDNVTVNGTNLTAVSHAFQRAGNYTVTAVVTDDSGNTAIATHSIEIKDNVPPEPRFWISGDLENEQIVFNATNSTDNERVLTYMWDFGDGFWDNETGDETDRSGNNSIVVHVYRKPGTFIVTLTIVDTWGNQNSTGVIVEIRDNSPPEARFTTYVGGLTEENITSYVTEDEENMTFDASESSDTSGIIAYYLWDFGDNTTLNTSEPVVNHTYTKPGTYEVNLTVSDPANHTATLKKTITVRAKKKVDFYIANLNLSQRRIREGDRVIMTVEIGNSGTANLTVNESVLIYFYANEDLIGIRNLTNLTVGEKKEVTLSWTPERGNYEIKVVVDPEINTTDEIIGSFDEWKTDLSGEENNSQTIALVVEKKPAEDTTVYIGLAAFGLLIVVILMLRRKRKIREAEEALVKGKGGKKKRK